MNTVCNGHIRCTVNAKSEHQKDSGRLLRLGLSATPRPTYSASLGRLLRLSLSATLHVGLHGPLIAQVLDLKVDEIEEGQAREPHRHLQHVQNMHGGTDEVKTKG